MWRREREGQWVIKQSGMMMMMTFLGIKCCVVYSVTSDDMVSYHSVLGLLRVDISQDPQLRRLRRTEKETLVSGTDYRSRLRAE